MKIDEILEMELEEGCVQIVTLPETRVQLDKYSTLGLRLANSLQEILPETKTMSFAEVLNIIQHTIFWLYHIAYVILDNTNSLGNVEQ